MKNHALFITKLYLRIAPAFLAAVLLGMLLSLVDTKQFLPSVLLLTGLSVPGQILKWGDWFIGVYFWISIFYFSILFYNPKRRIILIFVIVYCSLSLLMNTQPQMGLLGGFIELDGNFFGMLGNSAVRGLCSIGIGILSAFIIDYISFAKTKKWILIYSLIEIVLIVTIFRTLVLCKPHNIIQLQLEFAVLLICAYHSLGLFTSFLNKMSFISKISKYTYSIFVMHIIPIRFLDESSLFTFLDDTECALLTIVLAIVLGVMTFHFIEKPIFNKLKPKTLLCTDPK